MQMLQTGRIGGQKLPKIIKNYDGDFRSTIKDY